MQTDATTFEEQRMSLSKLAPAPYRALSDFDDAIDFDPQLAELVRVRASILNGCAYCVDMHTRDARAAGETEQRLYAVAAWHQSPLFSERERAAFALTDAVTLIAGSNVPRPVYDSAAEQFEEQELAQLIWTIIAINAWNRVGVTTRM
jgi:AhpD family alkylhydroperoxidase